MTDARPTFPTNEIPLRQALWTYVSQVSPIFRALPLADMMRRSKYREVLQDALVHHAVTTQDLVELAREFQGLGAIRGMSAGGDQRALKIWLLMRNKRGAWRAGQYMLTDSAMASEACRRAGIPQSKPDRAARLIRGLCEQRNVARELWPRGGWSASR